MDKLYSGQMVPTGLSVSQVQKKRVARRPQHSFYIHHAPFEITPFLIAPVLPGETMKNLLFQSRAVSDQVKNPLVGSHLEHYFFYVPLRSLELPGAAVPNEGAGPGTSIGHTMIESMLLDQSQPLSMSTYDGAAGTFYNTRSNNGVGYMEMAYQKVVGHFFRDEGEALTPLGPGGVASLAKLKSKLWDDSIYSISEIPSSPDYQGNADTMTGDFGIDMSEFDGAYQTWQLMVSQKMTQLSFDDYLATFGVKKQTSDSLVPELIRYVQEWAYPTNTVTPQDVLDSEDEVVVAAGTPSSAFSFSVQDRADKDRFFREPGFVVGVTCWRPKLYLGHCLSSGASQLNDALSWMPAVYKDNVALSIRQVAGGAGAFGGAGARTAAYWVDLRDLLVHGDQYVNISMTTTPDFRDAPAAFSPHATADQTNIANKYVSTTDIEALFVDSTKNKMRQDGIVSLNILGTQLDHT